MLGSNKLLERADGGELAALAVHALDRGAEQRRIDVDVVRTRDVRGALARDLDEAAGELELVGELVEVDVARGPLLGQRAAPELGALCAKLKIWATC